MSVCADVGGLSKQGSLAESTGVSREGSCMLSGPLSKQPSYIAMPSGDSAVPSGRRSSIGARLAKETSQLLALEGLAGDDTSGGKSKGWQQERSQLEAGESDRLSVRLYHDYASAKLELVSKVSTLLGA